MKPYVSSKTGKINVGWGGEEKGSTLIFPTPFQFSLEDQTEVCFMSSSQNTNKNVYHYLDTLGSSICTKQKHTHYSTAVCGFQ